MKATVRFAWVLVLLLPLAACGGGSSSSNVTPPPPPPPVPENQVPVAANSGVTGNYTNGLFTSVTVCVPGTTNCTTIDNVLV
ncbi:MAG: DUF3443 family protein, partial [Terriglobales bacterium]